MSKRYSDELGEWIKQKPSRKWYKNLAAFLAVKTSVQEALSEALSQIFIKCKAATVN